MRTFLFLILVFIPTNAFASQIDLTGSIYIDGIISTIVYSALGIMMAFFGYKIIDLVTPGHLSEDIARNNNVALAILAGSLILGICHIIAAALVG